LETPAFQADWKALVKKIDALDRIEPERFNAADIAEALLARVRASFQEKSREDLLTPKLSRNARYVISEAPAVAMFGGVSVQLSDADIAALRDALIAAANGAASDQLGRLVENAPLRGKPWQDGYDLAEDFLDRLEEDRIAVAPEGHCDVRALCEQLDITINQKDLNTESIRGVALAGEGYSPSILVNTRSSYNSSENGRRFTIAHELCHILHDQSRARRIAHASGPWAPPGVEKRANAFAAWLLMPPRLLHQHLGMELKMNVDRLHAIAGALHVADSALIEHLFNISLIDEVERDDLRTTVRH
jgi:Zn-dependent peptidase ImmA (M78 family)